MDLDGVGTINPADLDSSVLQRPSSTDNHREGTPRGIKRSRSPDPTGDGALADGAGADDETKPRKRGRPQKQKPSGSPQLNSHPAVETPTSGARSSQPVADAQAQTSPTQPSPQKSAPSGKSVKALPTQRDHTTDQLAPEGDEYLPREWDDAGEQKVSPTGNLADGREYRCRTFLVPNRGDKLFMLATECARVLNYRDSYLLFNKNRSLFKIIASQPEKDDLIHQEILPYSYRSRQIAIVTAKSMYRQFGARMIVNGRRVRDDYWESKARKQGFTEDDLASEKRPNTTKKETTTTDVGYTNVGAMNILAQSEVLYRDDNNIPPPSVSTADGYAMLNFSPNNMHLRDFGNIPLPRQEISGIPYEDRTQSSTQNEIVNQAAQAAQVNQRLAQQREPRARYLRDSWHREHEQPELPNLVKDQSGAEDQDAIHAAAGFPPADPALQNQMLPVGQQQEMGGSMDAWAAMDSVPGYPRSGPPQNPMQMATQMRQQMRPDQMQHQRHPSYPYSQPGPAQHTPMYAYPPNAMWPPQQGPQRPQPSPHPQQQPPPQQHPMAQFTPQPQHSPHPHQSPHHAPPPQLAQQPGVGPMGYQGMAGMPMPQQQQGYPGMPRGMYQPSPTPQQFMHPQAAGSPPQGMSWPPQQQQPGQPGQQQQPQQGWGF